MRLARLGFSAALVTSLRLLPGQSLLLSSPEGWRYGCIDLGSGFLRLATSALDGFEDFTLAFLGERQTHCLRLPRACSCRLEAITEAELSLTFTRSPSGADELIADWLLALRLVRQPPQAEARLDALFRLLLHQLGQRTGKGYWLPFLPSHGRLAELIGCTRSTVTRRITLLRDRELMAVSGDGALFAIAFVESC